MASHEHPLICSRELQHPPPLQRRGVLRADLPPHPCLNHWRVRRWVIIDDPFDPDGAVSVKLTEAEWQSVNPASTPRDASHGPHHFSRN